MNIGTDPNDAVFILIKSAKRRRLFAAVVRICFSPADRNNVNNCKHPTTTMTATTPTTSSTTTGSYFEAGRTNRVEADFEGVECGCAGRSVSQQSSGSGGSSSTVIAIATLTALVALLVLVVLCLVQLKKRRTPAQVAGDIKHDACIQNKMRVSNLVLNQKRGAGHAMEAGGVCRHAPVLFPPFVYGGTVFTCRRHYFFYSFFFCLFCVALRHARVCIISTISTYPASYVAVRKHQTTREAYRRV